MNNNTSDNYQKQSSIVDNIKNILSDFNTKLIFILVSLFVLCNTFIINVIDKYIDRGILSGFNDNLAERILFILVIVVLICYCCIDIYHNKKISNAKVKWALTALLFWAYYRFFSTGCPYIKFWNLEHIYYVDIVSLFPLSIIIKKLLYKHLQYKPEDSNGFVVDLPIHEKDSDSLKRDDIANNLAIEIKNTPIENGSFSVGIESPWGYGKTSFINLLCNHFNKKDTIIIKFNPWSYEKGRSLVDAFFSELCETLKVYDSSLSTKLSEYGNILSHSNHDTIKFGAEFIQSISSQSIRDKRKEINTAIKIIGKLILVVIDDLDRLDKDEIMSVLKMIRNSADFSNMVFVSAYDREYLNETLKTEVYNCNVFLEKIFQYQFKLPEYDKTILRTMLYNKCKTFLEASDKEQLKNILGIDSKFLYLLNYNIVLSNIDNPRDVCRFLNSFKFVYQRLKGEIVIKDLIMIELLRMKYNYVYELLSKEPNKYLDITGSYYILWNADLKREDYVKKVNRDILEIIGQKYDKGSKDFEQIESLLTVMFPKNSIALPKAINNPSFINRYFYYSLLESDISEEEFKTVMEKPYDEIKQNIYVWLKDKKVRSLSDLIKTAKFCNEEEYKKIVRSIFYIGYEIGDIFFTVGFIYSVIIKSPLTPEDNKAFINKVFFENGASEFVAKFIQDLFAELLVTAKLNLKKEECHNISEKMLQLACDNNMRFDKVLSFLDYTSYLGPVDNHDGTYHLDKLRNERADEIFISYVKVNYTIALPHLIDVTLKKRAKISDTTLEIWNGKEAFKSFIDELMDSNQDDEMLKEFSEFMNKYLAQEPLVPISFNFKYINLNS